MLITEKTEIRSKIKGYAAESKYLRRKINKSKNIKELSKYVYLKQHIGKQSRYTMLAYAFARGVPYKVVESKCQFNNYPSAVEVLNAAKSIIFIGNEYFTLTNIKNWLDGKNQTDKSVNEKIIDWYERDATPLINSCKCKKKSIINRIFDFLAGNHVID